jgi:hypothetical protein
LSNSHSIGTSRRFTNPKRRLTLSIIRSRMLAAVETASRRHVGDRLTIAAVEGERDVHPLSIIATDLQPIRAPASVGPINGDAAVMPLLHARAGVALEQKAMPLITR